MHNAIHMHLALTRLEDSLREAGLARTARPERRAPRERRTVRPGRVFGRSAAWLVSKNLAVPKTKTLG
jgi:hypothetical protein